MNNVTAWENWYEKISSLNRRGWAAYACPTELQWLSEPVRPYTGNIVLNTV